jgi:hypothetical protein
VRAVAARCLSESAAHVAASGSPGLSERATTVCFVPVVVLETAPMPYQMAPVFASGSDVDLTTLRCVHGSARMITPPPGVRDWRRARPI